MNVVDLPAPFGPSRPKISPGGIENVMSRAAVKSPNVLGQAPCLDDQAVAVLPRDVLRKSRLPARCAAEHVDEGILEARLGRRDLASGKCLAKRGTKIVGAGVGASFGHHPDGIALNDAVDRQWTVESHAEGDALLPLNVRRQKNAAGDAAGQIAGLALEQQLAGVEQQHAVAAFGLVEIGGRPDHGDALAFQLLHHAP